MNIIGKLADKILDISELRISRKRNKDENPSLISEVITNPEKFKLEAVIEGKDILIKISKREP